MQDQNWDDLRFFLAIERAGTLVEAGNRLKVSETTVARRLCALERRLGATLFLRNRRGKLTLSGLGELVLPHAETAETEHLAITSLAGEAKQEISGTVRLTSVPIVLNRLLIRHLATLHKMHPDITLELVADSRNLNLSKREADLAIRLARPTRGGLSISVQKLGSLAFAVFAPAHLPETETWIGYDEPQQSLPQARWIETASITRHATPQLNVSDAETALEAVAAGLGKTLLPKAVEDARLMRLDTPVPPVAREIWLLSHRDEHPRAAVNAVKSWISGLPWE